MNEQKEVEMQGQTTVGPEESKKAKTRKKESVIFVGSGTFWGGKVNGDKPVCRFNKNYLYETSEKKEIDLLRKAGYNEVTEDEIKVYSKTQSYQEIMLNILRGKDPIQQTPGTLSQNEVDKLIGRK